ncbi:MAG: diguanylate cyclase [Magnetococcales bacterium]|nr:diguanylate cyclase [Magnetococcales bacterium]
MSGRIEAATQTQSLAGNGGTEAPLTGRFRRIGHRIMWQVGLAVLAGLSALLAVFITHQQTDLLKENTHDLRTLTESVRRGLETVMLAGYADIAEQYADSLKGIPGVVELRLMRRTGEEAFRDNRTLREVNRRLGGDTFEEREEEKIVPVLPADHAGLKKAATGEEATYRELGADGPPLLTFLAPIPNRKACWRCHGKEEEVRGVLKLSVSLARMEDNFRQVRFQALWMGAGALSLILLLAWGLVRRHVALPIVRMSEAVRQVADGHLEHRVPVVGADELALMARDFNRMSQALQQSYKGLQDEQDKLTTIILSAREGIVVTDRQGDVVLVNPSAERLLGKDREEIQAQGFEALLDDPEYIAAFLSREGGNLPKTHVYKGRVLNFYAATIFTHDGEKVGSCALMRDVTQEKRLEEQLRQLSVTDGLTGLFNRRRFDEAMVEEMKRAQRYGLSVGLILFDVDHFKKFNDTHGHDQGDRVLQAIAAQMKEHFREIDHPCRYGGEEFCAILPSTGIPGAQYAAERLRQKIEAMVVDGLKVTISLGVAVYPYCEAENPDELLKQADNALYVAKKQGRNQVVVAGGLPESLMNGE